MNMKKLLILCLLPVACFSANDPPVIRGMVDPLAAIDDGSVHPFQFAEVSDADEGGTQQLVASVELDDPSKGSLGSLGGFAQITAGTYEMSGSPASISMALQGLLYVPAASPLPSGSSEAQSFDVRVRDAFVAAPTTNVNLTIYGTGTFIGSWRTTYFGDNTAIAMDGEDPDSVGLLNIEVYIFGTDPLVPNNDSDHLLALEPDPATGTLKVSHNGRSDDPTLLYMLEKSNDMVTWKNVAEGISSRSATPLSVGIERAVLVIDISDDENKNYRMKVYH
jgi:hypothetical protein